MAQLEFSVPYNRDAATLRQLIALQRRDGNVIREIYLNAPQAITGSGRVGNVTTLDEFVGVVSIIREAGIRVDVTMNSTCDGGDWYAEETLNRQIGFIRDMHEQHGIEAVTLANPFLIEQARQTCPNLEISASVLADIDCFSRAEAFALAGATTMTVDTSINRDLKLLRQIREKLGVELKLMVNEGCLNKCPYRKFHMNLISHKSHEERDEGNAFSFACGDIIGRDAGQIFKSNWIRPEDMRRYEGITSFFKIVGRDQSASLHRSLLGRVLRRQPLRSAVQLHRLLRHRIPRAHRQQGTWQDEFLQTHLHLQQTMPALRLLCRIGRRASGLWLDHSRDARGYGADVDDRRHRSAIRRQLPCLPLLFKDAP